MYGKKKFLIERVHIISEDKIGEEQRVGMERDCVSDIFEEYCFQNAGKREENIFCNYGSGGDI